jgi:hypothetical protein
METRGMSWTSTVRACSFADAEISDLEAFDSIKAVARSVVGIKIYV